MVDDGVPDLEGELVAEGFLMSDDLASPKESALPIRGRRQARRITTIRIPSMRLMPRRRNLICVLTRAREGSRHFVTRSGTPCVPGWENEP